MNFEGGAEKSRFDKGWKKVGLKYGKGETNYESVREEYGF